jgi:paraquat-inducible protein B
VNAIKEVFGNLSATLATIKDFVENPELKDSVHNLNETIVDIKKLVQHVDVDVAGSLKQTIQHADQMILAIDADIKPLFGKADQSIEDIDKLVVEVDKAIKTLVTSLEGAVKALKATSDSARPAIENVGQAFANIESMTNRDSQMRIRLDDMLKELSAAARSIKTWADYLERHPEALISGKGNPK